MQWLLVTIVSLAASNYYVSNISGNDDNSGLSVDVPWKSIQRVNKAVFDDVLEPGDSVLFHRGEVWHDGLLNLYYVVGDSLNPIVIGAYGADSVRPELNGELSEITWRHIEASQYEGVYYTYVGYRNSVLKVAQGATKLKLRSNRKHQDLGEDDYYSFETEEDLVAYADAEMDAPGVFGPWSYTEHLFIRTFDGNPPDSTYRAFTNSAAVRYCNYLIVDGITFKGGFDGVFIESSEEVVIKNSLIEETLGIGIKVAGYQHHWENESTVKNVTIENNTIRKTGNNLIYALYSDKLIIRGNDLANGAFNPYDIPLSGDRCITGFEMCFNTVMEYNYVHDSKGCHFYDPNENYGDSIRYNVVYNTAGFGAFHGGNLTIHNNIYHSGTQPSVAMGGAHITSNESIEFYENIWFINHQKSHSAGLHSYGDKGVRYSDSNDKQGKVNFHNNLVVGMDSTTMWMTSFQHGNTVSDSNCYYSPTNDKYQDITQQFSDLEEFKEVLGHDHNSIFIHPDSLIKTSDPKSWSVGEGYPCVGAGVEAVDFRYPEVIATLDPTILNTIDSINLGFIDDGSKKVLLSSSANSSDDSSASEGLSGDGVDSVIGSDGGIDEPDVDIRDSVGTSTFVTEGSVLYTSFPVQVHDLLGRSYGVAYNNGDVFQIKSRYNLWSSLLVFKSI
ncbi:MAG: right-handed parallel beta-helix repeat-containing protein [Fibrobacterales bacterium]